MGESKQEYIYFSNGYKKINICQPNIFKEFDDFTVSYNFLENETALIIEDNYFILNGDFREEYENLNKEKALKFFIKKAPKRLCFWSFDVEEAKKLLKEVK